MPLAADRLLLPPGWRVTRMALKWSGVSTTLGSLVAATIVRVIAGAVGVFCADADSARAVAVNSAVPKVIIRTVTSLVRGRRIAILADIPNLSLLTTLTGMSRELDRVITQGGRASAVAPQ